MGFCFGGRMSLRYALERPEVRAFDGVGHAFVTTAEAIGQDPVQGEAWALPRGFLRRALGGG